MTALADDRQSDYARALRQLVGDFHAGRLSQPAYRRLRRALLDAAERGVDVMPVLTGEIPAASRPGRVVWMALAAIVALLATLAWLFR